LLPVRCPRASRMPPLRGRMAGGPPVDTVSRLRTGYRQYGVTKGTKGQSNRVTKECDDGEDPYSRRCTLRWCHVLADRPPPSGVHAVLPYCRIAILPYCFIWTVQSPSKGPLMLLGPLGPFKGAAIILQQFLYLRPLLVHPTRRVLHFHGDGSVQISQ